MSFSASSKRVRDTRQPIGRRVSCLHECIERFNLFGFEDTRARLRAMLGVDDAGWTSDQLLTAAEVLEQARRSWMRFLHAGQARQREARRTDHNRPPLDERALQVEWMDGYLQGAIADEWLVAGLGTCLGCGHGLIHHGGYACAVCGVIALKEQDPVARNEAWAQRCREPLPPPR